MEQKIKNYSLAGKWDWVNTAIQRGNGWQILKIFAPAVHVWDFRENGVMESMYHESTCYRVLYKWDERKMILSLNGHKLDREGNKYCLVYESYNVLFLNPDEFYLIDTEDYLGMADSHQRLHFKRI